MKNKLDRAYETDGITVLIDFWVWCMSWFFKIMAFCLVGAMLLTGIKEGREKITGTKTVVTQPNKASKVADRKDSNPKKQTKERL